MEPDHQYHVIWPDQMNSGHKFPLVIAIDPHGDGFSAMQKFRDALKDLPVVIAGSDKLRNNYGQFEASLNNLYNDLLEKYPVDPQKVIVAGFSGGARMALYYGLRHPVHGIIMFGAGPGRLPADFKKLPVYAVSGTRDFNFIEQYRPLFSGDGSPPYYVNDYFRGIHEWPPERFIREAVVYCLRAETETYKVLSHRLSDDFLQEYDSLLNTNDLLFAGKALEKAWNFAAGTRRQKELTEKINAFKQSPDWLTTQKTIETFLQSEGKMKRSYAEKLVDPDTVWWSSELDSLINRIDKSRDPVEQDYYYRLKGFLGIYLYSQINGLLQERNSSDVMDRLLTIYEHVEPDSEDLIYFKSELRHLRE